MKSYACYEPSGQYIVSGICESDLTEYDIPDGCSVYYGEVSIVTQYHDIAADTPAEKGTPPADGYKFNYTIKSWEPDTTYLIYKIGVVRLQKLQESDWTDTASAPARLGQTLYDQWQTYRQALRDIPEQPGYPLNVVWPTPPQ
jgi:hypothetical protein